MSDVWRCAVCEGVNTATATCATCGAPRSVAARRATATPTAARATGARGPIRRARPEPSPRAERPSRPERTSRAVDRFADAARIVAAAGAERAERARRVQRERREAERYAASEPVVGGYDEPERPRLRVIPTPFGCLFSLGPRRRRRWG